MFDIVFDLYQTLFEINTVMMNLVVEVIDGILLLKTSTHTHQVFFLLSSTHLYDVERIYWLLSHRMRMYNLLEENFDFFYLNKQLNVEYERRLFQ